MIDPGLLGELRTAQDLIIGLVEDLDDASLRQQYHPELSPLGWHVGHCAFTECYWLQEILQNDDRFTAPVAELYTPPRVPKPERGARLPAREALLQWAQELQSINLETLTHPPADLLDHPLLQDDYLVHFLIQHYSQHFETMIMVLTQRALAADPVDFHVQEPITPVALQPDTCDMAAGHYRVGGHAPVAYDNELPSQQADLGPYRIARQPVSNSEFLAFMEDGGYRNQTLWSEPGWHWQQQHNIQCPDHWRSDPAGHWYGIGNRGPYTLTGADVLHGISRLEAQAFAAWAGGRLPHEHQWEVACRLQLLEQTGRAWEWCDNCFYPYAGFTPFPYTEYSTPWFDDRHYSLRGGSLHTRPAFKRPSFRNFYQPQMRHIFAGLRLVF
ncbi:MAG: SUMF1/EgtB/PvdO family nonheme iron enzyme [Gammaproteobacteria bacterium]|nr:SUMF1/EgtB/PvdO family nonheme iron enzyme [Gammaproteobacteria bacterium]